MGTAGQHGPLSKHDSDAVYIDRVDVVIGERPAVDEGAMASLQWAVAGSHLSAARTANPPRESLYWTRPPPESGCSCPIYIWHLTLLV